MPLDYILVSLAVSLLLTLLLELLFALVFGIKGHALLISALANILTNPAVVILHLLLCRHYSLPEAAAIPLLEISAVLTEALIYAKCTDIRRPFLFSLGANTFSYFSGALISALL